MADFCKKCSYEMFNEDFGDLSGISTYEDSNNGLFAVVLCEGCGPTQVNHEGYCVNKDCLKHHGNNCGNCFFAEGGVCCHPKLPEMGEIGTFHQCDKWREKSEKSST